MALPKSGVTLVADNASAFFRDMTRGETALGALSKAAAATSGTFTDMSRATSLVKLDALGATIADQVTRLGLLNEKLDTTKQKYGETSVQARTQEATIARLNDRLDSNRAMYALLAQAINDEADAAEVATQEAAAAAAEQQRLGSAYEDVVKALAASTSATNDLSKSISGAGDKADAAKGKFSSFSEIAIGGLRRLGEIGVDAIGGLGTKLVGAIGTAITAAGDYEGALNRFKAVSGGALSEAGISVDTFSQKFLQLGADTQFSALQAADAANELAKGGVPVRDILGSAAEATLNLASAAEMELAPAAGIVAKQLGVWGKDGVNATQVVDALSQAANASTVDVDELALGMANAGGSARVAGVSFQETVQTLGILSPGFSSAADAGTSFKTFLARLPGTTAAAVDKMTQLGLYTRESGSAFYDASGQFVGMEKASELLKNATANLSEEQKTLAFNTIFGADAIRTAAMLAEGGGAQFDAFAKSMDGVGSAADQAKQRNQGFNFAMETLRGSAETVAILFGQKILPAITGFINDGVTPTVNAIGDLITNFGSVVDTVEDYLMPAVVAAGFAFTAFAVTQVGGLVSALTMAGVALVLSAQRFGIAAIAAGKAALAFAAANAPLIVLTATVGLAVFAWNKYSEQVADAEQKTLSMAKGYGQAGTALDNYSALQKRATDLSPALQAEMQGQAFTVARLKGELEAATKAYYEVGGGTAENFNRIVTLNDALKVHSAELEKTVSNNSLLVDEQARQKQAMLDSMTGVVASTGSWSAYNEKVRVSAEVTEEALAVMAKVREDGVAVFDTITQSRVDFNAEMDRLATEHEAKMLELQATGDAEAIAAEEASYRAQQETALASYQEQQAAQRAHLGQMLIDYINAQAQLNPEFRKSSGALISAISEEYGVQASLSDQLFGAMLDDIDKYATDGSGDIDALIGKLRENESAATDTQTNMDALAKEYRAELISNFEDEKIKSEDLTRAIDMFPAIKNTDLLTNFLEGKIDAQELLAEINKLPSQKTINVHTSYTSSGSPPQSKGGAVAMAGGGVAKKGTPIMVGDGPGGRVGPWTEMFVPEVSGRVLTAAETQALIRNGGKTATTFSSGTTSVEWPGAASAGGVGVYSGANQAVAGSMDSAARSMVGGFESAIRAEQPSMAATLGSTVREGITAARSPIATSFADLMAGLRDQVAAAKPAIEGSLASIFAGAARASTGILLEQAATLHSAISSVATPAPTATLNPAMINGGSASKTYQLNLSTQQSSGSIIQDFKIMEAFSLG